MNSKFSTRLTSFGNNRGRRLREGQQSLYDSLLPEITVNEKSPDLSAFNEWWLEIGFGGGEHLVMQAQKNADVGIIGCEPYINGISKLLQVVRDDNLQNVRIHSADARDLMDHLPDASIARAFILFPDPWPKARHHKRRIINHDLFALLHRILKPNAELLIATDHEDYLTWILEHIQTQPYFSWTAQNKNDWQNPPADWVTTKYQAKAIREGRIPHWLKLQHVAPA